MRRVAVSSKSLFWALALASLGGAGCSSNHPPVISGIVATPASVAPGGSISLVVSATDPDQNALSYSWTLPAGWTASGAQNLPTLILTSPAKAGQSAAVGVSVTDGHGGTAQSQILVSTLASSALAPTLTVLSALPNPVAPGGTATLTAQATSATGTQLTYAWTVVGTGWTATAVEAHPNLATLTAPQTYGASAPVTVTVTDANGTSATGTVVVATADGSSPVVNYAKASPPVVAPGGTVQLTASAQSPKGLTLTYTWSVAGTGWSLGATSGPSVSLVSPKTFGSSTTVALVVSDSAGASVSSTVAVATAPDATPVISAIDFTPTPPMLGQPVTLSAETSTPAAATTYAWSMIAKPSGSTATLTGPTTALPTFTPDLVGNYQVELTITDAAGTSSSPVQQLVAVSQGAVSISMSPSNPAVGAPVTFVAEMTPAAPTGTTYAWSVASAPAGSTATFTAATAATAVLTPDQQGSYTLQVSVTQPGAPMPIVASQFLTVGYATPIAKIAGTPLSGIVNTDLALDGSGSTNPSGNPLTYDWQVTSLPAGANANFYTDATNVQVSNALATCDFLADKPGTYGLRLTVTDVLSGKSGITLGAITLAGPNSLAVVSGNAQTGAVNVDLAKPIIVQVTDASSAPVPGATIAWSVAGGQLDVVQTTQTDANGKAQAVVRPARIAGTGTLTATLVSDSTASATATFTGVAGNAASLAVSIGAGTVDTGVPVTVQLVDMYGNPATDAAAASSKFELVAHSSSGLATFAAAPVADAGAATDTVQESLTNGTFTTTLSDEVAEPVTVTLQAGTTGLAGLPFSAWTVDLSDNAELGFDGHWSATPSGGLPAWQVATGAANVHDGSQSYGIALSPAQVEEPGTSYLQGLVGTSQNAVMNKLTFWQNLTVVSAQDAQNNCTAQPAYTLWMVNANGNGSPAVPTAGYPVSNVCNGGPSFAGTAGWSQVTFDVTDDASQGMVSPWFLLANGNNNGIVDPVTPAQASSWYVDDIVLSHLGSPTFTSATANGQILPGAAKAVVFTQATFGGAGAVIGQCLSGLSPVQVTAALEDQYGNPTQNGQDAFSIHWTGSAVLTAVNQGLLAGEGTGQAEIQFQAGQASITLTDSVAETLNLTLQNPNNYSGITTSSTATGQVVNYVCHSNPIGGQWSDGAPAATYDATEALYGCEAYYGVGQCTTGTYSAYPTANSCAPYVWFFANETGNCGPTASPGQVWYAWEGTGTNCGRTCGVFTDSTPPYLEWSYGSWN